MTRKGGIEHRHTHCTNFYIRWSTSKLYCCCRSSSSNMRCTTRGCGTSPQPTTNPQGLHRPSPRIIEVIRRWLVVLVIGAQKAGRNTYRVGQKSRPSCVVWGENSIRRLIRSMNQMGRDFWPTRRRRGSEGREQKTSRAYLENETRD